ncbi:peroxidase-like protein 3 [Pomacea canaliculata]|uniref:peroxidase-like protein 3 n=1 Tax=Pomacea canaliculata TaxID=400727 RepID=UPI000D726366|nr:peroxidase-like protein 3 [Pomacea canaliculata]
MRYHNLIASELRTRSPLASSEVIFQQARSVVIAVMQNILYSEWLPIVLGPNVRQDYNLNFHRTLRTEYDENSDPRIFQAFSTAVFRFGHTLIPRSFPLTPTRRVLLRELFFKPFETRENMDSLTEGFLTADSPQDRTQPFDRFIVEEVTGHLFENQQGPREGFDLVALNIQRGRDHGLPPYNAFRQVVGLPKVKSFDDSVLGAAGPRLAQIYAHVDDIDLFSGGLSEAPHDGGLAGETFSRLMALQFQRLKFGDKFFFGHRKAYFGFTTTQYNLVRNITMAHVLCRTTGIKKVQRNVFRIADQDNKEVSCEDVLTEHPTMYYFTNHPW